MPLNLAKDAREIPNAVELEAWLREHREWWDRLRAYGFFTETMDRIEAEDDAS